MKVKISAGFCAVLCLLGWLNLTLCGWFLAAMAVHELAHLVALLVCRVPVQAVRFGVCGAVIETGFTGYGRELLCAVSGPLAGLLFGAAVLRSATELGVLSLGMSAVNLLPLYPMDGGRILRAALMMCLPHDRAEQIVYRTTAGVCMLLMLLACWGTVCLQMGIWPIFAALVLLCRAAGKEKQLLFSGAADKMRIQD